MEPRKLEELSRWGGKVVELVLNNNRHVIGFLHSVDTELIILDATDDHRTATSAYYRTPQTREFTRLDKAEAVSFLHHLPPPGTRVLLRLKDQTRTCGYNINHRQNSVVLAREVLGGRIRRPHHHSPGDIESLYTLKPVANEL